MPGSADRLIEILEQDGIQQALAHHLIRQRWFGAKGKRVTTAQSPLHTPRGGDLYRHLSRRPRRGT
jgi:hypothetical protein